MRKVLIGILIGIIVGVGSLFIYDKFFAVKNNSEKKENNTVKKEEIKTSAKEDILDIYSDQVQSLYNNVHNCFGKCYGYDFMNLYSNDNVNIDSLKTQAFYMAFDILLEEKGTNSSDGYKKLNSFTYDEVNNKAKLLFGKEFNVEEKKYNMCPGYTYDSTAKIYTATELGCGCTGSPEGPITTLYKATQTENQIDIYESVIYSKYIEINDGYLEYYKDAAHRQKIEIGICDDNFSSKKCIDNSTKYKFTYTLEDENYILKDITKVN